MNIKKIAVYVLITVLLLIPAGWMESKLVSAESDHDNPGDIVINPWENQFTNHEGNTIPDLVIEGSTTKTPGTNAGKTTEGTIKNERQTKTNSQTVVRPAKVKIKTAQKKKSAKKVKITLRKKVQGADGYRVRFYATKKNAKKNQKGIVTVETRKNRKVFTVTHRKLKNRKTLYVRIKSFLKVEKKKYYSKKWSAVKNVRIKK